jgi:hypothetical protein
VLPILRSAIGDAIARAEHLGPRVGELSAVDLAARARVMQAALAEPEREVLAVVESGDAVAVAFRLAGRHVGPLDTPVGRLPASGARIDLRVIDVLSFTDGRISAVWMVGDWLGALAAAGLVQVPTPPVGQAGGGPQPAGSVSAVSSGMREVPGT